MTVLAAAASAGSGAFDQPGTLGFLVVFGMAVILYFVFRSMAKHLRKVNAAARQEEAASSPATARAAARPAAPGPASAAPHTASAAPGTASASAPEDGPAPS